MESSKPELKKKRKNKVDRAEMKVNAKKLAKEAEEAYQLERLLFGNIQEPSSLDSSDLHREEAHQDLGEISHEGSLPPKQPVWQDEEEGETRVNLSNVNRLRKLLKVSDDGFVSGHEYVSRLRAFHSKLNPASNWALLPSERRKKKKRLAVAAGSDSEIDASDVDDYDEDDNDDYALHALQSTSDLVVRSRTQLPRGILGISRLRDANAEEPSEAVVHSVQFHRNAQILLTAGYDQRLCFFQIDGKRNPKVQSIFLHKYPILKASFVPDGSRVVASGRRNFYYVYDMSAGTVEKMEPLFGREERSLESFEVSPDSKTVAFLGNEGYILLASLKSKQLVGTLKMNGSVRAVSFAKDGQELLGLGGDGEVYHWDIGTRRCIHRGRDEGNIKGTSMAVSPDYNLFATGSSSGVVNLYDRKKFIGGASAPAKTFMNLLTSVDVLKFNADAQILAMASKLKKNAVKLVHLPSCTVFSNWPSMKAPLHYVHTLDFSPGGGYLAAGNAAGKVLLYRVQHYEKA